MKKYLEQKFYFGEMIIHFVNKILYSMITIYLYLILKVSSIEINDFFKSLFVFE